MAIKCIDYTIRELALCTRFSFFKFKSNKLWLWESHCVVGDEIFEMIIELKNQWRKSEKKSWLQFPVTSKQFRILPNWRLCYPKVNAMVAEVRVWFENGVSFQSSWHPRPTFYFCFNVNFNKLFVLIYM